MPGPQGYAVVSCHVERPLDDAVWQRYRRLLEQRPGGFPIASLMRPPAEGEDGGSFVGRAREAAARGPYGHHIHWTSPTHARPTGPDPAGRRPPRGRLAARAGARAALLLRRRLVHRRGGDGGGRRPRLRRLHRDVLAAARTSPRGLAARRARPARLGAARRRPPRARAADDALARRSRPRAAPAAAAGRPRALPRLRAPRRAPAGRADRRRSCCSPAAGAPPGSTTSPPSARSPGTPYAPADRRRGARRPRRLRLRQGVRPASPSRSTRARSGSRSSQNGKPLVAEDADARLRYQLDATGDAALAHERDLVEGRRLPGRDERARPHGDRHRRDDADRRRGSTSRVHPATGIALVIDAFDTKPHEHFLGGGERGAGGRPARPDPLDRGRTTAARTPRSRTSRAPPAGASGSRASARRRWRSPARRAATAARSAASPSAASRRSPTAPRSASPGAVLARAALRGTPAAGARRLRGRDRGAAGAAAVAARADQVARRRHRPR